MLGSSDLEWPDLNNISELYICGYVGQQPMKTPLFPELRRLGISGTSTEECYYNLIDLVAPNLSHLDIWPSDGATPLLEDPFADSNLTAFLRRQYPRLQSVNGVAFPAEA